MSLGFKIFLSLVTPLEPVHRCTGLATGTGTQGRAPSLIIGRARLVKTSNHQPAQADRTKNLWLSINLAGIPDPLMLQCCSTAGAAYHVTRPGPKVNTGDTAGGSKQRKLYLGHSDNVGNKLQQSQMFNKSQSIPFVTCSLWSRFTI